MNEDSHITPEPHLVPGYDGHCSQYQYYVGGTYGHLTHKALLNPCIPHAKDINLAEIHRIRDIELPTRDELKAVNDRQRFVDAVFQHPMIPGYAGCVPRLAGQVGKRYLAAATSALAEHEELMEVKRCEYRNLVHGNILQGSEGLFAPRIGERMISTTKYRAPLIPVNPKSQGIKVSNNCDRIKEKIPYSKYTVPHFKEDADEDKWIIYGYCGHIPNARYLIGKASKSLTRSALNQFSDGVKHRRHQKICEPNDIICHDSSCAEADCEVYRSESSLIPKYAGHVPGRIFQVGKRYAVETKDAKNWLRLQKWESMRNAPPACGEQCRR